MPRRVSLRRVDSDTTPCFVHEAYDDRDNLIATNLSIEAEADLQDLRDKNVRYVVYSSSPEPVGNETGEATAGREEPSSFSPDIETPEGPVSVQDARETYQVLRDTMESVYSEFRQGIGDSSTLEDLKPLVEDFLGYVRKNPAGLAVLTNIEEYDDMTFNHSINTCIFSILYGHHRDFDDVHLFDLAFGALLHDFGKTQLPISLVQKEGKLTDAEFDRIKDHPREGRELLERYVQSPSVWKIAYQHHERPDGSGYPEGTAEIHPDAQIVSVVDTYEALTAPRPYRSPVLPAKAFITMKDEFYPFPETRKIWNNLIRCMGLFSLGSFVRLSNGMIGVVEENNRRDLAHPVVRIVMNEDNEPVDSPFTLDLHRVDQQKVLKENYVFDDSIQIEKAMSLNEFPHLKSKIKSLIQDQKLILEDE